MALNSKRSSLPFWPQYRVLMHGQVVVQILSTGLLYGGGLMGGGGGGGGGGGRPGEGGGGGGGEWSGPQALQLLPTELIVIDSHSNQLSARLPLEKMAVSADERGRNFTVRTAATGISLLIDADRVASASTSSSTSSSASSSVNENGKAIKNSRSSESPDGSRSRSSANGNSTWLLAIRKQIYYIDNQKLKLKTSPKEEILPQGQLSYADRLQLFYADSACAVSTGSSSAGDELRWTAPPVDGLSDEYLHELLFPHKPLPHPTSLAQGHQGAPAEVSELLEFVNEHLLQPPSSVEVDEVEVDEVEVEVRMGHPEWDRGEEPSRSAASAMGRNQSTQSITSMSSAETVRRDRDPSYSTYAATGGGGAQSKALRSAFSVQSIAEGSSLPTPQESEKSDKSAKREDKAPIAVSLPSEAAPTPTPPAPSEAPAAASSSSVVPSTGTSGGGGGGGGSISTNSSGSQPMPVVLNPRRGPPSSSSSTTTSSSLKRSLINPKFILTVLKGITHRFVLVLECEHRRTSAQDLSYYPPRFTVGGAEDKMLTYYNEP
jgi:hypothetical protein